MRGLRALLGVAMMVIVFGGTAVMACACDEVCHDGEVYSDAAEMCMPKDKATS